MVINSGGRTFQLHQASLRPTRPGDSVLLHYLEPPSGDVVDKAAAVIASNAAANAVNPLLAMSTATEQFNLFARKKEG
jgi:hypothetical protein